MITRVRSICAPFAWLCLGLFSLGACADPGAPVDAGAPPEPEVLIGIPDPDSGLEFVPLEDGDPIPLDTFGQGGTHASLAVRCIGFGDRAYVDVTLRDPATDIRVSTAPTKRPSLLLCREAHVCDLIPLFVMTGGLAAPEEKDGLVIEVTASVHNEAGVMGEGRVTGELRAE